MLFLEKNDFETIMSLHLYQIDDVAQRFKIREY